MELLASGAAWGVILAEKFCKLVVGKDLERSGGKEAVHDDGAEDNNNNNSRNKEIVTFLGRSNEKKRLVRGKLCD